MWLWLSRTRTALRVGDGSSLRSSASPVSTTDSVRDVSTPERLEHLGRQHLAHRALQRQPAVARAAPRRLPAALGAEVHEPPAVVAALREEEAPPVAEVGVVGAELVAVIAERERLRQAAGQRREAGEMRDPVGIAQALEADRRRGAVVPEAEDRLRKVGGADGIVELRTEGGDGRLAVEDHAGNSPG